MTQVVKGRRYYDTCGRRWKAVAVMEDHAVLRRYLVHRTTARRKDDGKWWVHYYYCGYMEVYLITEGDR